MRKILVTLGAVLAVGAAITYIPTIINAEQQETPAPAYAKWGRVAMEHAKSKYPNASIIDYLHIGREMNDEKTTETFKLWLKEGDREFGLYLHITFSTKSEQILEVKEQETDK